MTSGLLPGRRGEVAAVAASFIAGDASEYPPPPDGRARTRLLPGPHGRSAGRRLAAAVWPLRRPGAAPVGAGPGRHRVRLRLYGVPAVRSGPGGDAHRPLRLTRRGLRQ